MLDLGPARAETADAFAEQGLRGASFRAGVVAPVGAVAQVLVNGEDCGWAWAPPYAVDVTGRLRAGEDLDRAQRPTTSGLREVPALRFGPPR